jgi:hypothetical protein
MHRSRRQGRAEAAATSLEFVGIALAAAVLLGGVATGVARHAAPIAGTITSHVSTLVAGEQPTRRWRDTAEVRRGGGSEPARVSRDDLRIAPVLDRAAAWQGSIERGGEIGRTGARGRLQARACMACVHSEWAHELGPAAPPDDAAGDRSALAARGSIDGRVALVAAQLDGRIDRRLGRHGSVGASGRVRGTVGVEGNVDATARAGRGVLEASVDAGAMAGASVRAQARFGIDLLGISIEQHGRAEAWAGAGARGTAAVTRDGGKVSWRLGWGAALGVGGAGEWSGSVDVSGVPKRHRRLARDALLAVLAPDLPLGPLARRALRTNP